MTAEKLHDAIGLLPADLIAETDKKRCGRPKIVYWKRYAAMAACFALVACAAWFASIVLAPRGAAEAALDFSAAAPAAAAPMEQLPEEPACEEAAPEEPVENGVSGETSNLPLHDGEGVKTDLSREDPDYALPAVPENAFEPEVYEDISINILTACPADRSESTLQIDWAVNWCVPRVLTSAGELEAFLEENQLFESWELESLPGRYSREWFSGYDLVLMLAIESSSECVYTPISLVRRAEDVWELTLEETFTPTDNTLDPVYRYVLLEMETGLFQQGHSLNVIIHTP